MTSKKASDTKIIPLPKPKIRSRYSLERGLFERRSIREYTRKPISLEALAQLLWSCQGITAADGLRATPSAGAVYPLESYAAVERVEGLPAGIYRYFPGPGVNEHHLQLVKRGRCGEELLALTTKQDFIKTVAVNILLATVTSHMAKEYGEELAPRFVHMEMGHAAQNVHLQAEALGLGSVAVGYLQEKKVAVLIGCEAEPQYMISIGVKKR
ncbi:SagB/ThcOx family dehydrogenase [bacterium]|nr:SagB/ThcOx family dehydrogenase [bacterium]MBU1985423.1 SagB/ThcOx family dehydrogenase [bacterium]